VDGGATGDPRAVVGEGSRLSRPLVGRSHFKTGSKFYEQISAGTKRALITRHFARCLSIGGRLNLREAGQSRPDHPSTAPTQARLYKNPLKTDIAFIGGFASK
jgi:hypothetical protein